MKLNKTMMYALACLWEMAQNTLAWMMAGDIARKHSMPVHYCYKVLELLERAGLIESARGRGFRLVRSLDQITCLELMEACNEGVREEQGFELDFANGFKTRVDGLLNGLTLQDLVKNQARKEDELMEKKSIRMGIEINQVKPEIGGGMMQKIKQGAKAAYLAVAILGLALSPNFAASAVPTRINFQGRLLNSDKLPRTGTFNMTFRICTASVGDCETPCGASPCQVWTETQDVSVSNGVFAVQLGSEESPLTAPVFSSVERYLEIVVDGAPPETLSPRERLMTGPYAFRAAVAEGLADDALTSNTQIAAGANIDAAKLADGSVSNTEFEYLNGKNADLVDTNDAVATAITGVGTLAALTVSGQITAGSGSNVITTLTGKLDATQLANAVPNESIDASSVAKLNAGVVPNYLIDASSVAKLNAGVVPNYLIDASSVAKLNAGVLPNYLIDASSVAKLNTGLVPNYLINAASITKQGNLFNGNDQLLMLDGSAKVPVANASEVLSISDLTDVGAMNEAQGDVLYYDGGSWNRLAAGTDTNVLQTHGAGQNPTWAPVMGTMPLWGSDAVAAVALQGSNLPAALTALDATIGGATVTVSGEDIGSQVQMHLMARVVTGGAGLTITVTIRDVSNTANILGTLSFSGVTTNTSYVGKTAWAAKPAWLTGDKKLSVFTSGGDGAADFIFRDVSLRWK